MWSSPAVRSSSSTSSRIRSRSARKGVAVVGAAGVTLAMVAAAPSALAQDPPWRTVATGLDNPRHLSIGPGNDLFVAEAGLGGEGPCFAGAEGEVCFGDTGAITRVNVKRESQQRVLTGLPSAAAPGGGGSGAVGPHDVITEGAKKLVFTVGLGADPTLRGDDPGLSQLGTLRSATIGASQSSLVADLAQHEAEWNPIHGKDSNPGGFVSVGSGYAVADAGGNTLIGVSKRGAIETLAVFEDLSSGAQAVPTSVVAGPGGALYVSQLTGAPFPPGESTIWKVDRNGDVTPYATGLTTVTDLAFGPGNVLYAVQLGLFQDPPIGSVVPIPNGGGTPGDPIAEGLFAPYGIAIQGKTAYVTTGSVLPGYVPDPFNGFLGGQVIAIPLR